MDAYRNTTINLYLMMIEIFYPNKKIKYGKVRKNSLNDFIIV